MKQKNINNTPLFIKGDLGIEGIDTKKLTIHIQKETELIKYFTLEEMKEKLAYLPPDNKSMLIQFLWRTGVRITEAINIQKKDIDIFNNEILIKWLKNKKYTHRKIPIHTTLKNPLNFYISRLNQVDFIFPFSRQTAYRLVNRLGFGNPHKIRHSFAVNFLRQSDRPMALVELRDLLGHSKINTTMEYLKVVPSNQKKALNNIIFD
jgi:integrase/recombinase XerD